MSIRFKPLLLKPFNPLTPLLANHLNHISFYCQQQTKASNSTSHLGQVEEALQLSSSISSSPGP